MINRVIQSIYRDNNNKTLNSEPEGEIDLKIAPNIAPNITPNIE